MLISALLILYLPGLFGQALDELLESDTRALAWTNLLSRCGLIAAVATGIGIFGFPARQQLICASRRVEERLKAQLLAHVNGLPISWFDSARTGDLISRLTQDVELLRFLVGPCVMYGTSSLVIIPGGVYLMFSLSPLVALAALAAFLCLLGSMAMLMPRLQRCSQQVQEAIGDISQRGQEAFAGIRVLLAFGRAEEEAEGMRGLSERYLKHNLHMAKLRALINLFIHSSGDVALMLIAVFGAFEMAAGRMTTGELFQYFMLLSVMLWPLIASGWILASIHRAVAAADRIEAVFAIEPESKTGSEPELEGELEVRDLSFTYAGQSRPALSNVSFKLPKGNRLGLVGPVGSGKSTLLALILRLYDPPTGSIFIDGIDVCDIAPHVLRGMFAFAAQDPFLFSDTIGNNIDFAGADEVGGRAIAEAAVFAANLEEDLENFAEGYETMIGERGVTLSGGQKQRLSLARALRSQRKTLVLDDTLSAVDHSTETRILDRLPQMRGERSMLVSSHRLSAVRDSDLIVVLEAGKVVDRGRHAELLARSGYYATTWRRQTEEQALGGSE